LIDTKPKSEATHPNATLLTEQTILELEDLEKLSPARLINQISELKQTISVIEI
jgi:hypothetical protein